jgi:predicted NUDIX family NTP pyrophosphohydrolase
LAWDVFYFGDCPRNTGTLGNFPRVRKVSVMKILSGRRNKIKKNKRICTELAWDVFNFGDCPRKTGTLGNLPRVKKVSVMKILSGRRNKI